MACVGLNHTFWQVAKQSTPSVLSGQCRAHIRHILTFILLYTTSTTLLLHGPELTQAVLIRYSYKIGARANQQCSWTVFFPLSSPLALSFIIIKVRIMSQSLREVNAALTSEVRLRADSIYRSKATLSVKRPERALPGSESSWWLGSHPASILQHQGCGRPGLMKRQVDESGNILQGGKVNACELLLLFIECIKFSFYIQLMWTKILHPLSGIIQFLL